MDCYAERMTDRFEAYPEFLPEPAESDTERLQHITRRLLHNQSWREVNRRFHAITRNARSLGKDRSKFTAQEEAAFLDGVSFALSEVGRELDTRIVHAMFKASAVAPLTEEPPLEETA